MGGYAEVSLIPFGVLVFGAAVIEGVVALLFRRRPHRSDVGRANDGLIVQPLQHDTEGPPADLEPANGCRNIVHEERRRTGQANQSSL